MKYTVTKIFRLDFGHRIGNYNMQTARGKEFYEPSMGLPNKCANIHGHSVEIFATLGSDTLDEQQFVINTGLLKAGFSKELDKLDHALALDKNDPLFDELKKTMDKEGLRCFVMDRPPSFEALAELFYHQLETLIKKIGPEIVVKEIKIKGPSIEVSYQKS